MATSADLKSLPIIQPNSELTIALVGNPNAGKTTLFNRLTGLRAQTANFPGTTVEHRCGRSKLADQQVNYVDLPGLYTLDAVTPDEQVAVDALTGQLYCWRKLDAVVVVVDATNLQRNLFLVSQVLELGVPTLVALNMIDVAEKHGLHFELDELAHRLGCPVVPVSARTGRGVDEVREALIHIANVRPVPAIHPDLASCGSCRGCQYSARYEWAENVATAASRGDASTHGLRSEALDRILTHKVVGLLCFAAIMFGTFALIFWLAQYPMNLIDGWFGWAGDWVRRLLPRETSRAWSPTASSAASAVCSSSSPRYASSSSCSRCWRIPATSPGPFSSSIGSCTAWACRGRPSSPCFRPTPAPSPPSWPPA